MVLSYNTSFREEEQELFTCRKVPPEFANRHAGVPAGYICHLWDVDQGWQVTNASMISLAENAGWSSSKLWQNFNPRTAMSYGLDDKPLIETKVLMDHRVSLETAEEYNVRHYSAIGVIQLMQTGIPAEIARQYSAGCHGCNPDIPEETNIPSLAADHVVEMYNIGLMPDNTAVLLQYELHPFLLDFVDRTIEGKAALVGTGSKSIVVLDAKKRAAFKLGKDQVSQYKVDFKGETEGDLLQRLDNPNHVIKYLDEHNLVLRTCSFFSPPNCLQCTYSVLELEYIKGRTLGELVEKMHFSSEAVMQYGDHILLGLWELHQAGIYRHRDIRPANIILDEERDRAVIIDLGIATTEKEAEPKENERFGGPNDIVSLGQVMYFMATQRHLFTESDSMHVTKIKRDLSDERERVYADQTGKALRPYLEKVEIGTGDTGLAGLVKDCLTAKGRDEDYQRLEGRFKAYVP